MYDFQRCPKIVAIKAYRALRDVPEKPLAQPRELEPATIGKVGEIAVRMGLQGMPQNIALERIARVIPQMSLSDSLREIASESLHGVGKVREELADEYGDLTIIGKGEGRHPDLAGRVLPDFIAFTRRKKNPIIIETKDTTRKNPSDNFQASFYRGIAEKYGLYLFEERLEGEKRRFSPRTIQGSAEAILIYPRLASYSIVKEKFVPDEKTIRKVWKAKQLGFQGLAPEMKCRKGCPHHRLKIELEEGNMEPLSPLPLTLSRGVLECGFNYDIGYQVNYAWNLLPIKLKLAIARSETSAMNNLTKLQEWLTQAVGLDEEAAAILLDPGKREQFLSTRPGAQRLLKFMESDIEPWRRVLKKRVEVDAPSIMAVATAVYSLPKRSRDFVKGAWNRWH